MNTSQAENQGLKSSEYSSRNNVLVLGMVVFATGIGLCAMLLPDALSLKNYPVIAVSLAVFFIGVASLYLAAMNKKSAARIGQTLLFLDPPKPGIGGQLGGSFILKST